ncbi:MAG: BF3164 family lipoprotein [Chitinophagaceae bacterium]
MSSFKKVDKIKLKLTGQNGFFTTIAIIDTFLVCTDYRSPVILQLYGLSSNKLIGQIITRGDQPGQCLSVANILPLGKGIFWIYDITLSKLIKIDIKKALVNANYPGEEEIILIDSAKRLKSPCLINDSVFAATSYTRDDSRFLLFNKKSDILEKVGRLPVRQIEWPEENVNNKFNILASIYNANLIKHPNKEILVVAYSKTDRLEFYNQGKLNKIIRGPDYFEPLVSFQKQNENSVSVIETSKTYYSYNSVCATSLFIYCLYSGQNNYSTCSQKLLVYDWNGNPSRIIEFDRPVCYFTIRETENETIIYTVEAETGNICLGRM